MGTLLSYSGIATKIRAMQSRHIGERELYEILQLKDIQQVANYLQQTPEYSKHWKTMDGNSAHRDNLELLLHQSVFRDFSKLYQFANPEQRVFLELYSKRYEIRVLKEIMTNLFDHRDTPPINIFPYRDFFLKHSGLDLDRLILCRTMEEFLRALKGNEFWFPLARLQHGESPTLFDYGMALDLYYFSQIWKVRKKLFRGKDLKEITHTYGEKFDLLNLQFIRRARTYFHMRPAEIYAYLIPVHYRITKENLQEIVEADTEDMVKELYDRTYYGKRHAKHPEMNLEEFYNHTLSNILEKEARENPYSVAVLFSYMYHKEREVDRLITAIECIRYGVNPEEAMGYIRNK